MGLRDDLRWYRIMADDPLIPCHEHRLWKALADELAAYLEGEAAQLEFDYQISTATTPCPPSPPLPEVWPLTDAPPPPPPPP